MSKWIKKGDNVLVIAGNDKGKTGTVVSRSGERVVIKGINIRKKHAKSRDRSQASSIVEVELPIHISNTALCDDQGNKISVKSRTAAAGGKELYYLKEDKEVVLRQLRKGS
jgi:large subunit ribosomal protein L24